MAPKLNNPNLFQNKPFINGQWYDSKSTSTFKVYDPATQELIIELPDQTPEEIDEVIAITHKAFQTYQRTPFMSVLNG